MIPPTRLIHDDVIKWKHFPRNWPFVREIHRSPVNFLHKGQWRGALMFTLIYAWINDWVNNREAGDLRRQHGHYDVIVMKTPHISVAPKQYTCLASQKFILTRKPNWSRYIDNLVVRAFQNTNAYMSEFDLVCDKWLFTLDSIHIAMAGLARFVVNSSELRLFSCNHSDVMACEGFLYYWPFWVESGGFPL